ncbi:MAG TPA: protein kinase [Thermoanaerobaculia bacterium]
MSERRGLSLGTRIFLGTALVLLLVLATAIWLTSWLGERIAVRDARERIAASAALEVASQQRQFRQLGLLAEIMAGKPEFKAYVVDAIVAKDRLSLLDQLEERRLELGYDLALIVDADGVLAARTDQPEISGVDLSARPLIRQVKEEFEAAGVWSERGRLFEAVAVPMAVSDGLFGFLALGYQIGDVRALEVKRSTGSETIFVADAAATPVASSLPPQETERVLAALRARGDLLARVTSRGEEVVQQELELAGERWLARLNPLRDAGKVPVGAVVSLVSLDRALEGYHQIRNVLVATAGGALLVALALSYLVARRVSRPIGELVRATSAAREGRYDAGIPPGGSGEVLTLANSFNALLAELRERREMAEYVEKLARTMPEARPAGVAAPAEPAARRELALLAVELRSHQRPRAGEAAAALVERLSHDLRRVSAAIAAHGGQIESSSGARTVASFASASKAEAAVAAAADVLAVLGRAEHAFDEPAPPAMAIATGTVLTGGVTLGEQGARAVVGLPVEQAEALLREAGEGDLMLSPSAYAELGAALARAGLELAPRRGILSGQRLYALEAAEASALALATGQMLTHISLGGDAPLTLAGIGPGTLLGSRFEILAVLGAGGMGVVYKARDRELDDLVALKMLKREAAGDQALLARLKSELKLARKITHPNVLRTFDFGDVDGHPFISMEYVRGITLRGMLEQSGRLPYSAAVWLARQLLAGLAAAHALDILHRDIKPENVLLDSAGNLKLMDFGLARPVERQGRGETREGFIVGTPHYLAPEQIESREPDKRSDVYACGVVLFELFTGRLPFEGANPMDVLMKHLKQPPPRPRDVAPELPAALEALILACLAKEAGERPADAGEVLARLAGVTA